MDQLTSLCWIRYWCNWALTFLRPNKLLDSANSLGQHIQQGQTLMSNKAGCNRSTSCCENWFHSWVPKEATVPSYQFQEFTNTQTEQTLTGTAAFSTVSMDLQVMILDRTIYKRMHRSNSPSTRLSKPSRRMSTPILSRPRPWVVVVADTNFLCEDFWPIVGHPPPWKGKHRSNWALLWFKCFSLPGQIQIEDSLLLAPVDS